MVHKENVTEARTFSSVKNKDLNITGGKFRSRAVISLVKWLRWGC